MRLELRLNGRCNEWVSNSRCRGREGHSDVCLGYTISACNKWTLKRTLTIYLQAAGTDTTGSVVTVRHMRSIVQRVRFAKVTVNGELMASIAQGLCTLVGVGTDDSPADVSYMASKLAGLRVFEDSNGKMNLSVKEVGGEFLLVSQFTLFGDLRHGNRPSFTQAAAPESAQHLFEQLVDTLSVRGSCPVKTGKFRSHMDLELANDGPVTVLIDSRKTF